MRKWRQRRDEQTGLADKQCTGRPMKVRGGVKKTIESIKYKRGRSTRKLNKELNNSGYNISHVTVFNYIHKVKKWKSFKRPRNQLLTKAQRSKRLAFAKEHKHLSAQDWENYIFSDESTKYICSMFQIARMTLCGGLNQIMYLTLVVSGQVQRL